MALIRSAEDARPETRGHSKRVAELSTAVARAMGLPEGRVHLLARAAALHEVGRLASLGDREARGNGPAGPGAGLGDEWSSEAVMATEQVLAPIASLRAHREIILHSSPAAGGAPALPFGTERPGIPVESRILAVCKTFVRLAQNGGADREATRRALEAIRKQAGPQHDSGVVEALSRLLRKGGEA